MSLPIVKRPRAVVDIDEIADFIAEDSFGAAIRFFDATEQAFLRLSERPQIGAAARFSTPGLSGVRMWPIRGFEKFRVFYQAFEDRVEILRVLHSARDIDSIFEEESLP